MLDDHYPTLTLTSTDTHSWPLDPLLVVQLHTVFLSVITRTMVPIPPTATAWREKRGRRGRREISSGNGAPGKLSYLFMPHEEDSTGVLSWVSKAPVDVLHEDVQFI